MLRPDPHLLDRLDIGRAIVVETRRSRQEVPSRVLEHAVEEHLEDAVPLLKGMFENGLEFQAGEVIQADKSPESIRPLTLLSFPHRVLYQALADEVSQRLADRVGEQMSWEDFELAPLSLPPEEVKYVVRGDVASFYQYIDHELLVDELIAQLGAADIGSALGDLLHQVTGRRFGLPQLYRASDVLAEVVIDIVERRLVRSGATLWRRQDDFRFACPDSRAVREVLRSFERELRVVGLVPNEVKTGSQERERYQEWITAAEQAWQFIETQVAVDFDLLAPFRRDEYEDDDEDGEEDEATNALVEIIDSVEATDAQADESGESERLVTAAAAALAFWHAQPAPGEEGAQLPIRVYLKLLRDSLGVLTTFQSDAALPFCKKVLTAEPQLTPRVARYLYVLSTGDSSSVLETLASWVQDSSLHLSNWQSLWLLEPVLWEDSLPTNLLDWARGMVASTNPSVLRARAALALAQQEAISGEALADLYSELPPTSRADVVAALTALLEENHALVQSVARESPFNRWVVESTRVGVT